MAFHPSIPKGIVISQDPPAGEEADPEDQVNFVVSRGVDSSDGGELISVPDVVGQSRNRAEAVINDVTGLTVGTVTKEFSNSVPAGNVIRQSPTAKTKVDPDSQVNFVVSLGPSNVAPSVEAGPAQTITLPSSTTLKGVFSDDGLPDSPGVVTTTWTKVSGPGTVTFGNAAAVNTTVSFTEAGTYSLRLTADDSDLRAFDDTTITVMPA